MALEYLLDKQDSYKINAPISKHVVLITNKCELSFPATCQVTARFPVMDCLFTN